MRVVLDTNILVSRVLSPAGLAARIFDFLHQGAFEPVVTVEILAEYRETLGYEDVRVRHRLSQEEIEAVVRIFVPYTVSAAPIAPVCRDPDDDMFLACAVAGGADYLVSNDPDLKDLVRYQGIRIISAATFLALLKAEEDSS